MADEAFAGEAAVRRRLRWHEVANSLVILCFALVIVAVAAFVVTRSDAWHSHRRPAASEPAVVAAPAPVRPAAKLTAPAAATPPPVGDTAPVVAPTPGPAPPKAAAAKPKPPKATAAPPEPQVRLAPPAPTIAIEAPAELSAMERPSGPAAKQMLNSIKCFDEFEFDYRARGRQYFSALCKGGNRKQVSCAGAGCKIEYARPPSHAPTGE